MLKLLTNALLSFVLVFALASQVSAGGEENSSTKTSKENSASKVDSASRNIKKTDRFIPGEKVITSTGQELRVWSTEGPVPVSRAPEPFEDREKTVLDNSHIVVDVDRVRRRRTENNSGIGKPDSGSFDMRRRPASTK